MQRLGGRAAKKIDFRLITATNEDLEDAVRKGGFRDDLYTAFRWFRSVPPAARTRRGTSLCWRSTLSGSIARRTKSHPSRWGRR